MNRSIRPAAAVLVALGVILASFGVSIPLAGAQTSTTTTLEIGPSETTEVGEVVTFTATVTPSDASGTVRFYEGDRLIQTFVPVVDGVATVELNNFATGTISNYNARFSSNDPDTWSNSISANVSHTVVPGDLPVMECEGADDVVKGILRILPQLYPSDGVVVLETPIEGNVMEEIPVGPAVPVSFSWTITIPDYLIDVAAEFGAEYSLSLKDIDMAVEAGGAASGEWNFPTKYPEEGYIADPYAPIVFTAAGSVTATTEGEITYEMAPGQMTVFVPLVGTVPAPIDVILDCEFINAPLPSSTVEGDVEVPIFTDVGDNNRFNPEINWMFLTGLSTGYEPGPSFRPDATLTRQAMSAFIYRINGSPLGPDPSCNGVQPFPDVLATDPFCGEIAWMKAEGITTGNPDGGFNPNGGLSRQAMSAFLYRSANGSTPPPDCTTAPFPDVPTTNQFCPEIAWMAETGISTGFDDGEFKPLLALTRQAMSAFLYRYSIVVGVEL